MTLVSFPTTYKKGKKKNKTVNSPVGGNWKLPLKRILKAIMLIDSQLQSLQKKRFFFNNIKFGSFLLVCLVSYLEVLPIKIYIKPQLSISGSLGCQRRRWLWQWQRSWRPADFALGRGKLRWCFSGRPHRAAALTFVLYTPGALAETAVGTIKKSRQTLNCKHHCNLSSKGASGFAAAILITKWSWSLHLKPLGRVSSPTVCTTPLLYYTPQSPSLTKTHR